MHYTNYFNYLFADHVWQEKRAAIAATIEVSIISAMTILYCCPGRELGLSRVSLAHAQGQPRLAPASAGLLQPKAYLSLVRRSCA